MKYEHNLQNLLRNLEKPLDNSSHHWMTLITVSISFQVPPFTVRKMSHR